METRFVIATVGMIWLGALCMYTAARTAWACHYVRETLFGVGAYLLLAGLIRESGPLLGIDGTLTREVTGWLAGMAAAGLSWTALAHWLFHRFLAETLEN